jgi:hypothetical protein
MRARGSFSFVTARCRSLTACNDMTAHLSAEHALNGSGTPLHTAGLIVVYVERRLVLSTPAK